MRMSHLFGKTLRAAPAEVEVAGHRLLLRAGYIRPLAAGIFSYLPLGVRVMRRIEAVIREEMEAIGGQEITMPVVHPAELWQRTGRWYDIDEELVRFADRTGRNMVLAMTHEEVVADLARSEVRSYRQLPLLLYQIQTKFRDDPRPRAGLIRVREFTMKDSYSLDADVAGLELQYRNHYRAYVRIFQRVGLSGVIAVAADPGMMGGHVAHEFMFLTEVGEDTLALCDRCGYAANIQVAGSRKPVPSAEQALPLAKVATPGTDTIEALASFLGVPKSRTAKVVFLTAAVPAPAGAAGENAKPREVLVMALVRGDMDVNEAKLGRAIRARRLTPASAEAIRAVGAQPGYASPIVAARGAVLVVADDLVAASPNLIGGANEVGFHYRNINAGRDFQPDVVADIADVSAGAPCPRCEGPLRLARGVEVGNIFQLGTRFAEALGAKYLDAQGQSHPVVMGSYGIGVGRLLACIVEANHDERGIRLPITIAPYDVHLVRLSAQVPDLDAKTDALYEALRAAGIQVLYDDRDLSAGVKFADADLIGLPLRVTISARSLQHGGCELKRRDRDEVRFVPLDEGPSGVCEAIRQLRDEAAARLSPTPYPAPDAAG
jgi:prolyl-tRNA synthetase